MAKHPPICFDCVLSRARWVSLKVLPILHIAILFLLPMPRLTANFFHQPYAFHAHAAIDGFAHIVNR